MSARPAATSPAPARLHYHPALQALASVRCTGLLQQPGRVVVRPGAAGAPAAAWLHLVFAPAQGLPYQADVYLGSSPADRVQADLALPLLRPGALVSVGARALELRADHDTALLRLVDPRDVYIPEGQPRPLLSPSQPHQAQEADNHAM